MDKVEAQRKHFDAIADVYLKGRSAKNHLAYKQVIWNHVLERLARFLPARSPLTGLEAMCGNAEVSARLVNFFPHLTMHAFDLSDAMVKAAETSQLKRVTTCRNDLLTFCEEDRYDLAVIIGGLHHIPYDVHKGVHNIGNSLKKGGIFLNLEPTHNNRLWRAVREKIYKDNAIFEENSERAFTLQEYNTCLTANNFRILDQFYPGLLGYVLYYNPDAFPALNIGPPGLARMLAGLDLRLGTGAFGRIFSFATWTIAEKI
ncbi:class I SAM-dependent methyltransferase [Geobacter sp. FeAm09]|uniref:methyltransferase domain-containing protein n=1 Tax=Geobacter sp. FeAm09 TaxID=2597769 RepID=UPI0011EF4046|nr:class I SAM-dependent methyltransferase [Geobacter sp. FeAm09]QEM69136.1 class I SAM-dependent methyltransferase [Geobacter sp. FeAm09]